MTAFSGRGGGGGGVGITASLLALITGSESSTASRSGITPSGKNSLDVSPIKASSCGFCSATGAVYSLGERLYAESVKSSRARVNSSAVFFSIRAMVGASATVLANLLI